ncbi:MAG TPA: exodeoxyribonuclease VII large subunit [Gemmatimonadaceae bacterium]|nr:exodeoxyribonuclease VII large subunit [Gemmatimonadaceae bacterium]
MTHPRGGRQTEFDGAGFLRPAKPVAVPGATRDTAITISELNEETRTLVERSFGFFWVRGEVTDFKSHRNGHWYFSLRDATSQMSCVVWSRDQQRIPAPPDEGMQVIALAQMTMYPARGTLQLRIGRIDAAGDGLRRKAMQLTIDRLRADGLLDPERKRALPRFPSCVAIVTSSSGAALHDIISVAHRRRPGLRIVVSCASVQGDTAPRQICNAIRRVVKWGSADVLIVGRGGGSREDLWAFNDERVARAIAGCSIPVISAVGHEIDTTVCDLVADMRVATPSVAAEAAVPALPELHGVLELHRRRIVASLQRRHESAALDLKTVARDMRLASLRSFEQRKGQLSTVAGRLNALSPLGTLARGYAVARDTGGRTLSSVSDFREGDPFRLILHDGEIHARVEPNELRNGNG